jgi:hypothetical protein
MTRINKAAGLTKASSPGAITFMPSTADSTVIAGVITASPKKNAVPMMPRMPIPYVNGEAMGSARVTTVISDRIPPSPRLSARVMIITYFRVTTSSMAQNTKDRMPSTLAWLAARP